MKKQWIDENGIAIPSFRITKSEKLKEAICDKLLKEAEKAQAILAELKTKMSDGATEVLNATIAENGGKTRDNYKGNFTFFNFDRSVKIEASVQEKIVFDDAMIIVAKDHFDTFLGDVAVRGGVDEMIKEIITDAFSTAKGALDADKVLGLTKYRARVDAVKYPAFHAALDAIEKSVSRQFSKKYHRISKRNEDGKYEAVDLNFSSL
jgi:hypothetical protein